MNTVIITFVAFIFVYALGWHNKSARPGKPPVAGGSGGVDSHDQANGRPGSRSSASLDSKA